MNHSKILTLNLLENLLFSFIEIKKVFLLNITFITDINFTSWILAFQFCGYKGLNNDPHITKKDFSTVASSLVGMC